MVSKRLENSRFTDVFLGVVEDAVPEAGLWLPSQRVKSRPLPPERRV